MQSNSLTINSELRRYGQIIIPCILGENSYNWVLTVEIGLPTAAE